MNRADDWFSQAKRDLDHAQASLTLGHYEWACFAAHQSAEKALKALHMKKGTIVWGHSILDLLEAISESVSVDESLYAKAQLLDKYYVPPRYPNAHPSGPPYRYYNKKEASEAIEGAKEVIKFCDHQGFQSK